MAASARPTQWGQTSSSNNGGQTQNPWGNVGSNPMTEESICEWNKGKKAASNKSSFCYAMGSCEAVILTMWNFKAPTAAFEAEQGGD